MLWTNTELTKKLLSTNVVDVAHFYAVMLIIFIYYRMITVNANGTHDGLSSYYMVNYLCDFFVQISRRITTTGE